MNHSFKQKFRAIAIAFVRFTRVCGAFLFACALTSCSWLNNDINDPVRLKDRDPALKQLPDPSETVRGDKDPPIVKLELGKALRPANLRPSQELPSNVKIDSTNLNNVPVTAALQAVLADTDITLLWESEALQNRKVTLMNLKGSLPVVVDRICRAAKILCGYRNGALELAEEDTFVVQLPGAAAGSNDSAEGLGKTIAESIEVLINGRVKADTVGGNLIYTTDAEGHERVQGYLDQLRNGRPLIVLQMHIWQVTLDDDKKLGIRWRDLHLPKIGGVTNNLNIVSDSHTSTVADTEGVSIGAVLSGAVDVNLLAGFLATQGKVQTISSPQLTFVSGTSAKFEVGNTEKYVSQVGTLTNGSVAGSGTTSGATNNTVNTEELKTGIMIETSGNYENGVVFSNMKIKTSDLLKFTLVDAQGVTLQLPKTADRVVQTVLRVRPGDNLVLAGLQSSTETRTRDGLPGPGLEGGVLPTYGEGKVSNAELVIMVKPSIVFFNDKDEVASPPTLAELQSPDTQPAPNVVAEKTAPQPVRPVEPSIATKPDELQSEFGQAVKTYENISADPSSVNTSSGKMPQNISPYGGASGTESHGAAL